MSPLAAVVPFLGLLLMGELTLTWEGPMRGPFHLSLLISDHAALTYGLAHFVLGCVVILGVFEGFPVPQLKKIAEQR